MAGWEASTNCYQSNNDDYETAKPKIGTISGTMTRADSELLNGITYDVTSDKQHYEGYGVAYNSPRNIIKTGEDYQPNYKYTLQRNQWKNPSAMLEEDSKLAGSSWIMLQASSVQHYLPVMNGKVNVHNDAPVSEFKYTWRYKGSVVRI